MLKTIKINIPNALSILRIALIPVVIYAYFFLPIQLFLMLFFITAITDFLDGFLARKLNQITKLGIALDVIADKLFVFSFFIILIYQYNISIFVILLMLSKDIVVIAGRLLFLQKFKNIKTITALPANYFTKITTTLQIITIVAIILSFYSQIFITTTIFMSIITAVNYIISGYKLFKKSSK